MGIWRTLAPLGLPKKYRGHEWVFAHYYELAALSDDGKPYEALYFRNLSRTVFGVKEFHASIHYMVLRKMAARIIQDKAFRESLVVDDPEIVKLWRRH